MSITVNKDYVTQHIKGITHGNNNLIVPYIGARSAEFNSIFQNDPFANRYIQAYLGPYKKNTIKYDQKNGLSTKNVLNFDNSFDCYLGNGVHYKEVTVRGQYNYNAYANGSVQLSSGFESNGIFARLIGVQVHLQTSSSGAVYGCGLTMLAEAHKQIDNIAGSDFRRKTDLFYEVGLSYNQTTEANSKIYFAIAPYYVYESSINNRWIKNGSANQINLPVSASYDRWKTRTYNNIYTSGTTAGWQFNRIENESGDPSLSQFNCLGTSNKLWVQPLPDFDGYHFYDPSRCWFSSTANLNKDKKNLYVETTEDYGYGSLTEYVTSFTDMDLQVFRYSPKITLMGSTLLHSSYDIAARAVPYYNDQTMKVRFFYDFIKVE